MKKIFCSIFFILILISTTACDKSSEEIDIRELMPSEVGNYWKYSGAGNEYADFEQKIIFQDGDKVQIQLINPGTSAAVIYEISDEAVKVVYSESEFYEEKNILDSEGNVDQTILKAPIAEGTTWTQDGRIYEIDNTKAFVETPSGNFENCVKVTVKYENQDTVEAYYYKPKLGLVFQEYKDGELVITSSLSEYNVQGYEDVK